MGIRSRVGRYFVGIAVSVFYGPPRDRVDAGAEVVAGHVLDETLRGNDFNNMLSAAGAKIASMPLTEVRPSMEAGKLDVHPVLPAGGFITEKESVDLAAMMGKFSTLPGKIEKVVDNSKGGTAVAADFTLAALPKMSAWPDPSPMSPSRCSASSISRSSPSTIAST